MLQFSEYDKAFTNIYCSQPILDINVEDSNRFIIRYPKFKEITHLIFSFDAENLYKAQTDERSDKMDNMLMRTHYSGYFGKIFYNEEKEKIIRIYDYPITDEPIEGTYLSHRDKKKGFLIQGNQQIQHFLPSKRFYSNAMWYLYDDTFYYLKWSELDDGQVYYMLDKVKIYNF